MKSRHKFNLLGTALLGFALMGATGTASAEKFVTIGTAGVTGVYYPTGGAICRLLNIDRAEHGIRCSVESTGGSVYNINAIRSGELDFGTVQSDVQASAYNGEREWKDKPFKELRSVMSVAPEPIHIMTVASANISRFEDLKGKRFNIGNPGSGQRAMAEVAMDALGWTKADFSLAGELKSSEQAAALCDGKMTGVFWAGGVPNGSAQEATSTCDIKIIPMTGDWVDAILKKYSAYSRAVIPGGTYDGNPDDIETYGTRGTLVTSANTPDDVVYNLVKAVFGNFEDFKKLHPAFRSLTKQELTTQGLTAPLHPGAVKYYKEVGLL